MVFMFVFFSSGKVHNSFMRPFLFSLRVTHKLMNNLHLHHHQKYFRNHKTQSKNSGPMSVNICLLFFSWWIPWLAFFLYLSKWHSSARTATTKLSDQLHLRHYLIIKRQKTIHFISNQAPFLFPMTSFPSFRQVFFFQAERLHFIHSSSHNTVSCPFSILLTPLRTESVVSTCSEHLT